MVSAERWTLRVAALVTLISLAVTTVELLAQAITVQRSGDALVVRAPALTFIKGEPLVRLKDGRALRVDLELSVLPGPGGAAAAEARQVFLLSYDLWEERFAVTQAAGGPSRSVSHRTAAEAEGWCLEQLTVPLASLGSLRDKAFWIRLASRVLDGGTASASADDEGFTLRALIDALSRRRKESMWTHSTEAGPFRLGS
jgi:hypothetical protein